MIHDFNFINLHFLTTLITNTNTNTNPFANTNARL